MKLLRPLSFSLMGIIIVVLILASVLEQVYGTDFAVRYVYTAPWTLCLWAAAVVCALAYMFTVRMYKQIITCLLHFSFVVILGGALVSHLTGEQGKVHLRLADTDSLLEEENITLPFEIGLKDFHLEYYPGTRAPMDFVSDLQITDGEQQVEGKVSMNNIFSYRHYRFYQAQYDSDAKGVTLKVSHDPWGIGITYAGYAMLLLSMLLFFLQKRTHFKTLLAELKNKPTANAAIVTVLLACLPLSAMAKKNDTPPTVDQQTARELCNLYVYYNDRVCPLQTLAVDFTTKLYGKPSYKGLSAEEVFCGWLFYYDQWAKEPCIKIKGKDTRRTLGIEGKYACLNDYVGNGKYKLESALQRRDKNAVAADEKFRLISMTCTGTLLSTYPVSDNEKGTVFWYSWADELPVSVPIEDRQFAYGAMDYVYLCVARNANKDAQESLRKIRTWQQQKAGKENLPSATRFNAEKIYNSVQYTRPLAMGCATIGILLFIVSCILLAKEKTLNSWLHFSLMGLMLLIFLFLTAALVLRWIVSAHVPLSNGFETMQFMAWVTALITSVLSIIHTYRSFHSSLTTSRYSLLILPFGYLLCGMTLMVSMMSAANPQITNLMPVLQSPLLSIHVSVIMIAYCLLAFVMMNGITGIVLHISTLAKQRKSTQISEEINLKESSQSAVSSSVQRLQIISQLLLYPAVFLLTIGIFIGAVWANISWGSYWQWDPKEVWALITMLVYAAALHTSSLTILRKPLAFHIYTVIAFLFVLFTYFGVNFVLGGMHSYA